MKVSARDAKLYTTEADWVFFQRVSAESIYGMKIDGIPLAVIKETADNFLDAAEKQKVDPEIEVKYTTTRVPEREGIEKVEIEMTSNTLMSREDIESVYSAPFGSRTSSKTFVKVPSRGLFGMANKLIQALPYMLSMELGLPLPRTPIEIQASSEGLMYIYDIGADVDRAKRTASPICIYQGQRASDRQFTTFRITFFKPKSGKKMDIEIRRLLLHFYLLNPELQMTCDINGVVQRYERRVAGAHRSKGRPSVANYSQSEFVDTAYAQKDPYPDMTVLRFLTGYGKWPGFKGFYKEIVKPLLEGIGLLPSVPLSSLTAERLTELYGKMLMSATGKPSMQLSVRDLSPLGKRAASLFENATYKKGKVKGSPPWLLEALLITATPEMGELIGRTEVVVGINRSPLLSNPFGNFNLKFRGKKWSTTWELLEHVPPSPPLICIINLNGLVQPLSPNKSEIDTSTYLVEYKRLVCSIFDKVRVRRRGPKRKSDLLVWLEEEIIRRIGSHEENGYIPEEEWASQQSLWYKARKWYLSTHTGNEPDISRDYFVDSIREICKRYHVSREYCGIFAAERAMIYFRGRRMGVSLESIEEVFRYGSDLISIEKEGICALLEPLASIYGIAIMNSRGQLVDYAEELIERAKKSGAHVWLITDLDDAGLIMRKNLPNVSCIGVDSKMITELGAEEGKSYEDFRRELEEGFSPKYRKALTPEDYELLGWDGLSDKSELKRIEIDSVLAAVGRDRFWHFLLERMRETERVRDITRSLFPDDIVKSSIPASIKEALEDILATVTGRLKGRVEDELLRYRAWDSGFVKVEDVEREISDNVKKTEEKYAALYEGRVREIVDEIRRTLGTAEGS